MQRVIMDYYSLHGRSMPWRDKPSPYRVLVSEMMLQQTQVSRVIPKFNQFIETFPDIDAMATASLPDVLAAWSGLGYNRRAKFLWQAAHIIKADHNAEIPNDIALLQSLPGIGRNTAAAICCYAYNQPTVFVETNIRTVFLYHFYQNTDGVSDSELLKLVERSLDADNPRIWYWALMDYGTHLKRTEQPQLAKSTHYRTQSAFNGSIRQVRGTILKLLLEHGATEDAVLRQRVQADERYEKAMNGLIKDGLVGQRGETLYLTGEPPSSHNEAKHESH